MTSTRTAVNVGRVLDAQARMLADQKRRLEQLIAAGNPLAWGVYNAIYGDTTRKAVSGR